MQSVIPVPGSVVIVGEGSAVGLATEVPDGVLVEVGGVYVCVYLAGGSFVEVGIVPAITFPVAQLLKKNAATVRIYAGAYLFIIFASLER